MRLTSANNYKSRFGWQAMNKNSFFTLYLLAISTLMVALLFSATSRAYGAEIAVVNIQKVLAESKAASSIRTQVQSKQKSFQNELDSREKKLQKENQELAQQRNILAKEEFDKKVKSFRSKAASAQKEIREKRMKLDKAFAGALGEIQKSIASIAKKIANEKGADIAVASSQLIYFKPNMDITSEVITQLNKEKPKVNVAF